MSFNIWNNLDEIGLFLGLKRLDSETNESYFNRIRLFGRWKYKTDYLSQVHSIPLQAGLNTTPIIKINSQYKFECSLDYEFFYLRNSEESIRIYVNCNDTVDKILTTIDKTATFTYSTYGEVFPLVEPRIGPDGLVDTSPSLTPVLSNIRSIKLKYLVRDSNIRLYRDYADSPNFNLTFSNIVKGTLSALDDYVLITEKDSIIDLKNSGDYFVDYDSGFIQICDEAFNGATIVYKYYDNTFRLESTEMNLTPVNLKFKYGLSDEAIDIIPLLLDKQVWG